MEALQFPKRKAIFLDRDGVINQTIFRDGKPRAPDRLENFKFFPDVPEAIEKFRQAGFLMIVVTNQPDVARGWQTRETVEAMNQRVRETLHVDDIKVCYHLNQDGCICRKPEPGMLIESAEQWNIDLSASYMIGDRYSDIAAGQAVGCTTLLIGEGDPDKMAEPDARVASLGEAAEWIMGRASHHPEPRRPSNGDSLA